MTKTLKDYFKEFEDKVVGIETISKGLEGVKIGFRLQNDSARLSISNNFSLIQRFIKAQPLENQRELWLTTIDLLNASKAFNDEIKEERREELLVDCFKELENLNNIILQLQTQKSTTNKPDAKFNWQGTQAQLVFLIEQLYEHGFLSPITQSEKFSLLSQHFTVKGESLNPKTLAQIKQNSLTRKSGKPKDVERIEQIVSDTKQQKP